MSDKKQQVAKAIHVFAVVILVWSRLRKSPSCLADTVGRLILEINKTVQLFQHLACENTMQFKARYSPASSHL